MRTYTLQQAEALFNRIQAKKDAIIRQTLQDASFVLQHFPNHEFAARKSVNWLTTVQYRLVDEFTH